MSDNNQHWGSTLDSETARAEAATRVVAWRLSQEMERQGISKAKGNVTIETSQRAAALVGPRIAA
jgi:hypothetical protein